MNSTLTPELSEKVNGSLLEEHGTEKGLVQGHAKRWVAHALKLPNCLKAFSEALFLGKVKEGVVSCWKHLGVTSVVFQVRSWSGKDVPVSVYHRNVILCLNKEEQGP